MDCLRMSCEVFYDLRPKVLYLQYIFNRMCPWKCINIRKHKCGHLNKPACTQLYKKRPESKGLLCFDNCIFSQFTVICKKISTTEEKQKMSISPDRQSREHQGCQIFPTNGKSSPSFSKSSQFVCLQKEELYEKKIKLQKYKITEHLFDLCLFLRGTKKKSFHFQNKRSKIIRRSNRNKMWSW